MNIFNNDLELIEKLNEEFPVSINFLQNTINKIFNKFPGLDKSTICIIVLRIFEEMREQLILGKTLSIKNISPNMKIISYKINESNKIKVKIKTPKKLK